MAIFVHMGTFKFSCASIAKHNNKAQEAAKCLTSKRQNWKVKII